MNVEMWTAMLRESLEDDRLSRGERRALREHLEADPLARAERDVIRARAFEIAGDAMAPDTAASVLAWLEDVTRLLDRAAPEAATTATGSAEAWFSPGDACRRAILGEIRRARRAVDVCVFTITDDRVSAGLAELIGRRIPLRVMTDDEKSGDPGSDVERLAARGAEVRLDRSPTHMHHKFALFDDARLLTGSYNWTRAAARDNSENLLVTADPGLITAYRAEFDRLWAVAEPI